MKAILLRRPGGPEALKYVEVPTPVPGEGKVLVKADTIGVSMPEVLVRRGTYAWMPALPAIPGIELSGTVVAHGPNTAEPALGQPVFVSARDLPARAGCYAEYLAVPARAAHPLPPGCSLEAAACLSNYQVAYHVLHTAARGVEAKRVLVHTAAGGVGSAAVQLALIAGLEVIGVAGSEKKTRAILGLSAQHAIDYRSEDVVARVRELTGGRGADLILDRFPSIYRCQVDGASGHSRERRSYQCAAFGSCRNCAFNRSKSTRLARKSAAPSSLARRRSSSP